MANTKIVVYGVDNNGNYLPLQVDTSGFLNVHITAITPGITFPVNGAGENDIDAVAPVNNGLVQCEIFSLLFNGSTWDRERGSKIFRNVLSTAAGATAVWTPAAGKKFRLMGYSISVSGTLAAVAANAIQLLDGATVIARHFAAVAATVTGDTQIFVDLGQGILSAAANNALSVNIATAFTAGGCAVNVWGTEE